MGSFILIFSRFLDQWLMETIIYFVLVVRIWKHASVNYVYLPLRREYNILRDAYFKLQTT